MDGVWLPAGGESPRARGLPGSRHKPTARGQGGRAFCPLAAPANGRLANRPSRWGGTPSRKRPSRNRIKPYHHAVNVGLRPTQHDLRLNSSPKLEAVCRAGWRGERRRGAVRMTATGSVTPWMACGDRPVERAPEPGAFPTVGIPPAAGLLRTAASVLNPPPPTAGWQIAPADRAEPAKSELTKSEPATSGRRIGRLADQPGSAVWPPPRPQNLQGHIAYSAIYSPSPQSHSECPYQNAMGNIRIC